MSLQKTIKMVGTLRISERAESRALGASRFVAVAGCLLALILTSDLFPFAVYSLTTCPSVPLHSNMGRATRATVVF